MKACMVVIHAATQPEHGANLMDSTRRFVKALDEKERLEVTHFELRALSLNRRLHRLKHRRKNYGERTPPAGITRLV